MIAHFINTKSLDFLVNNVANLKDGSFIFCEENDRFYIKMHGDLIGITPKKREVTEIKCKHCGAPLNAKFIYGSVVKCEFCHTVYDIDTWCQDVK